MFRFNASGGSILKQKKVGLFAIAFLAAGPAFGLSCSFATECLETDGCADTTFGVEIDFPNHTVSTDFGDIEVVAISKTPSLLTIFGRGEGANYMLTVTGEDARLATHMTGDAMGISYLGMCEK